MRLELTAELYADLNLSRTTILQSYSETVAVVRLRVCCILELAQQYLICVSSGLSQP
jgi:hypothetical protein